MARPKKQQPDVKKKVPFEELSQDHQKLVLEINDTIREMGLTPREFTETFADILYRVDTTGQIEQAAKHLLRKAADGEDWAIRLVADLLRENNSLGLS